MPRAPLRTPIAETIYTAVKASILQGGFLPGTHLVEAELTQRYGVSRGTIREVLRRLLADELVEHLAHRGVRVRRLATEDVIELYTVREPVEGLAARLAAAAPSGARKKLQAIHAEAAAAVAARERFRFAQLNSAFHRGVAELSGNQLLLAVLSRLHTQLIGYQFVFVRNAIDISHAHRDHGAVLAAIAASDPDAAEASMRRHLRSTRDSIITAANVHITEPEPRASASRRPVRRGPR